MHTSNMIYQSAVAHQTDLRRKAAAGSRADKTRATQSGWSGLLGSVLARRARVAAAAKPVAGNVISGHISS
jgi:hypothetical protein